jgi:hypothetical protein
MIKDIVIAMGNNSREGGKRESRKGDITHRVV